MKMLVKHLFRFIVVLGAFGLGACSLKENTASTRFIHSFTTRYNVYYNGKTAYDRGIMAKIEGHTDDYTERLPVFMVGNEASHTLGAGDFSLAIVKSEKAIKLHSITRKPTISNTQKRSAKQKAFLKQKEYNPFLYNAWFLMGKAHFESGKFSEAASVFSYMMRLYATDAVIYQGAATWLARCYAQLGWLYEAEDVINKFRRDTLYRPVRATYNATMADLYLRQDSLVRALPFLEVTAQQARYRYQRARLYYLLGQVYYALQRPDAAYKALAKCIRLHPPYTLAFNARILQAEVMGNRDGKRMLSKLKRMASAKNNEPYLDQVYYAIGNIYLAQSDTAAAINAYELGETKAKRNDINKGVLLLRLGELYWARHQFAGAQRCYSQVVGLLNKTHRKYEEANQRSLVLDELVPHTNTIAMQDSLIALAQMPEEARLKVIAQAIAAYKKQARERARQQRDSLRQTSSEQADNLGEDEDKPSPSLASHNVAAGEWYFYNAQLIAKGKNEFKQRWGNRPNQDDWRRSNKTVLRPLEAPTDRLPTETLIEQGEQSEADSNANLLPTEDPNEVAYYLSRIPLTEKQMAAAHAEIEAALWQAGQIEQDKLNDLALAEATYLRLYEHYPNFSEREALCYQLFLLYQRLGDARKAASYRAQVIDEYPEGQLARWLSHPNYERIIREGVKLEDALYRQAYEDFKAEQYAAVRAAITQSTTDYPDGAHRAKFMLLQAFMQLRQQERSEAMATLTHLLQDFPTSEISPLATTLLNGLKAGRNLGSGTFDFNTLWQQRSLVASATLDSLAQSGGKFSADANSPYLCVIAFMPDAVDREQLLYLVSRFNFTHFLVRRFNTQLAPSEGLYQLRISGFANYGEARTYASQLAAQKTLSPLLHPTKIIVISESNLQKIGVTHSFADYATFHDKTFTPLRIDLRQNLDANDSEVQQHYEENLPTQLPPTLKQEVKPATPQQTTATPQEDEGDDGEVWYDID